MRSVCLLAGFGLICAVPVWAADGDTGNPVPAVWKEQHLEFFYVGRTARYSCDGLRDKVRALLLDLGARRDIRVTAIGCEDSAAQVRLQSSVPDWISWFQRRLCRMRRQNRCIPGIWRRWTRVSRRLPSPAIHFATSGSPTVSWWRSSRVRSCPNLPRALCSRTSPASRFNRAGDGFWSAARSCEHCRALNKAPAKTPVRGPLTSPCTPPAPARRRARPIATPSGCLPRHIRYQAR